MCRVVASDKCWVLEPRNGPQQVAGHLIWTVKEILLCMHGRETNNASQRGSASKHGLPYAASLRDIHSLALITAPAEAKGRGLALASLETPSIEVSAVP